MVEGNKRKRVANGDEPLSDPLKLVYAALQARDPTPSVLQHSLAQGGTIEAKITKGQYSSISGLQEDLLTATRTQLETLEPTDLAYKELNAFHVYAEQLIATESTRRDLVNGSSAVKEETSDGLPLRGYDKSALVYMGPHGPVFSSASSKSLIDEREYSLPANVTQTSIVPTAAMEAPSFAELSVSTRNPKIGAGYDRPTHPIHVPLPSARWLRYDAFSSFAPRKDEGASVVPEELSDQVWWERVGRDRFYDGGTFQQSEIHEDLIQEWEPDPPEQDEEGSASVLRKLGGKLRMLESMQALRAQDGAHLQQPPEEEVELARSIESELSEIIATLPPYTLGSVSSKLPRLGISFRGSLPAEEPTRPLNTAGDVGDMAHINQRISQAENLRMEIARRGMSTRSLRR